MIVAAIAIVFISAILHVTWNVMLQSTNDPLIVSTKAVSLGMLFFLPILVIVWILSGYPIIPFGAWFWGFLSGVAELGYFMFLSYSYRHGELSVVYPIARGSAPVLSFFAGVFLLQENVNTYQIVGVVLLIVGMWFVRQAKITSKGVLPALLTGVFIASYTVIDKVGLGYTTPVFFGGLKYLFTVLCLLVWMPVRQIFNIHAVDVKEKTSWKKIVIVGICIIFTYQLVLFAMSMAPVAIISPLRESASVIVTAWGIWKLKEREGLVIKIIGVIMIFVGIVLLAI